jgi:DNA-binding transcriptional LysR family regulator
MAEGGHEVARIRPPRGETMDLEELRSFLAVAETGSFLAAADALGVSRTTLRRRVGALEARAGVPLLETTPHGVAMTEAGRVLASKGRLMVEEASALVASVREIGRAPSGVLRVVMPVGLPAHVIAPLLAAMRRAYPRLSIHSRFSDEPLAEPLTDIDMAVHFTEKAPGGPWISHVVLRARERLFASREYLAKHGAPRSIQDLDRHELFAWQAPGEDARAWPTLSGGHFPVEPSLVATDIHLIRYCCIAGLGIGLIPDALFPDPGLPEGALVPVLPDVVGRERPVRVTVPKALADIPKIKMVLDHIQRFLGAL